MIYELTPADGVFREMNRILKDNGICVIVEPTLKGLLYTEVPDSELEKLIELVKKELESRSGEGRKPVPERGEAGSERHAAGTINYSPELVMSLFQKNGFSVDCEEQSDDHLSFYVKALKEKRMPDEGRGARTCTRAMERSRRMATRSRRRKIVISL